MATVLQIVDSDLTTVLFDFNDPNGTTNADGIRTILDEDGSFSLGVLDPDQVTVLSPNYGGSVVSSRYGLTQASWRQHIRAATTATTPDTLIEAVGRLGYLMAAGGQIKFTPNNSTQTRYIAFEPSPSPAIYEGQPYELLSLTELFAKNEGIFLRVLRQPFLFGSALVGASNLVTNGTLTNDFGGTASRPDGWAWTATTGLSSESITSNAAGGLRRGVYQFTMADASAKSLQFTTADSTYASGDVGVFSFYARVTAVAGTPQMQATLQFQTNAAANVGGLHSGGLVTLTTAWQRIAVSSTAAGGTTGQALVSIQIDNADATSVVVQVCNAQAEKTSLTGFRVSPETVAFDPASTSIARRLGVWAEGTAPTTGRLKFTADAQTLGEVSVYRETDLAVSMLKQTTHKQLESGTLGSGTTSTADGNASGGNTAQVVYPVTTPALATDAGTDSISSTVVATKPSGVVAGDFLLALIGVSGRDRTAAFTTIPGGWAVGATIVGGSGDLLGVFYKLATSAEPATYTWTFITGFSGTTLHAWIGRYQQIDTDDPIDAIVVQENLVASATINVPAVITSHDNNRVIAFATGSNRSTVPYTHTPPAGTTPTYTEQEDTNTVNGSTYLGFTVADGNLATAGSTGTKTFTATTSVTSTSGQIVLNKLPSTFEARSTVTWTGIQAGDYDVWLRFYPTAASVQRIEVEWAPVASPSSWFSLGEVVIDTTDATAFAYVYRKMGRIHIPPEWPLDTLTLRVNAGKEVDSTANLRLDFIDLVPVNEVAGTLTAPAVVASGSALVGDPDLGRAFVLDPTGELVAIASSHGAIPVPLEPGYNLLTLVFRQAVASGFVDRAAVLTASPTVAVDIVPRYR